jgi:hypothetical protein
MASMFDRTEWRRRYRLVNGEHIRSYARKYYAEHPDKPGTTQCVYRAKVRELVFAHYGKTCARCGYADERALSIDHIDGGGNAHRKTYKIGGSSFYVWLVKNNFPEGFQVLCMNCQFIKRHEKNEVRKRDLKI